MSHGMLSTVRIRNCAVVARGAAFRSARAAAAPYVLSRRIHSGKPSPGRVPYPLAHNGTYTRWMERAQVAQNGMQHGRPIICV